MISNRNETKTEVIDGSNRRREFLTQFFLRARANGWDDTAKAVVLASCLRGKTRSFLETLEDPESLLYSELKASNCSSAKAWTRRILNRRHKGGEDFAVLGTDLERLSWLAYSECYANVRNKIACSQFIAAPSDGYVKRTIQFQRILSFRENIEQATTIKITQPHKKNVVFWSGGVTIFTICFWGRSIRIQGLFNAIISGFCHKSKKTYNLS